MKGIYQLIVKLMYGCGLRMKEVQNIRIKDMDFGYDKLYIWDSKSLKDRTLPLPLRIKEELKIQVQKVKELHQKDLENGYGSVFIFLDTLMLLIYFKMVQIYEVFKNY